MTRYTLTASREEQKRIDICDWGKWFFENVRATKPDVMGKVFIYLPEPKPQWAGRSLVMRQLMDGWLNNGL